MRTDANTAQPRVAIKTDVRPDFAAEIRRAAQQDGRTVSGYIRRILVKHFEQGAERPGGSDGC